MTDDGLCRERHDAIGREIERSSEELSRCARKLEELSVITERTSVLLGQAAVNLERLEMRVSNLEQKPARRLGMIADEALKWAMLLVLGVIAARMGLS